MVAESRGTFYGMAMRAHQIYTVAGTGTPGFGGDSAPPPSPFSRGPARLPWIRRETSSSPTPAITGSGRSAADRAAGYLCHGR